MSKFQDGLKFSYTRILTHTYTYIGMCVCVCVTLLVPSCVAHASDIPPNPTPGMYGGALLQLALYWNNGVILNQGTSTLYTNEDGIVGWGTGYNQLDPDLKQYFTSISNATYTFQIYKGVYGSSTLVYSKTIENGNALSSGEFHFAFPGEGNYFMTYTATYPPGVYPINYINDCSSDSCPPPVYSLPAFESFMTQGQSEEPSAYENFTPAMLATNEFTVVGLGPHASNILFIPGFMESRLYTKNADGSERELWEPGKNQNVSELGMNPDGMSIEPVYTRDVIDYLYSNNPPLENVIREIMGNNSVAYGPFIDFLNNLENTGIIRTWQTYPYDWRYGVDDIISNGTLVGDSSGEPHAVRLQDVVQELASSSPTGKVTIIAHSEGGLLAKALAVELQKQNKLELLDRIILVGAPQSGTPLTIGDLLHGDDQTRALGLVSSAATSRNVSLTMPGAYDLLPTRFYFGFVPNPTITFSSSLKNSYGKAYGDVITTYDAFISFLTNAAQINGTSSASDLTTPAVLSSNLLSQAENFHAEIDPWVAPDSLPIDTIVGVFQLTPQGYTYSAKRSSNCTISPTSALLPCTRTMALSHVPVYTRFGDNTVDGYSAANISQDIFYFLTDAYRNDTGQDIVHQSLLSAKPIQDTILALITGSSTENKYMQNDPPTFTGSEGSTVFRTDAPVHLVVSDTSGNQTGIVPIDALSDIYAMKEDIPRSSIQIYGDESYDFVPDSANKYAISLQGYDTGTGSIEIGEQTASGDIAMQDIFENVSVTPSTTGSFSVSRTSDNLSPSALSLDMNGDGTTIVTQNSIPDTSDDSDGTTTSETPLPISAPPVTNPVAHTSGTSGHSVKAAPSKKISAPLVQDASTAAYVRYLEIKLEILTLEIELTKLLHQSLLGRLV